jgi:6-phosphogluconolactonase
LPSDFHGVSNAAEIRVHPGGRFLYVSNRGRDSIETFSIDPRDGRLTRIQDISSQGQTPRNFEFDPTGNWLIVTNQDSNNTVVFRIDRATGMLKAAGQPIGITFPFCPRFLTPGD